MQAQGDPFYAPVRQSLAQALSQTVGQEVPPGWFDCVAQGYPLRTAAPLRLRMDAAYLAQILHPEQCGTFLGVPLVRHISHSAGHLLFSLTPAYYTRAMEAVLEAMPPARDWFFVPGKAAYACVRMRMLARKPWAACPDEPAVQLALWRALGVPERIHEPGPLRLRLEAAAQALLTMTHQQTPVLRTMLLRQCGGVGEAGARLLSLGLEIQHSKGGKHP